jgi:hypothetical protein
VRALALSSVLLLAACTHQQAMLATGESFVALGETFATTAGLMDIALEQGLVSPDEYRTWATFVRHFKLVYVPAADLYAAALSAGDTDAAGHAAAVLAELSAGLSRFAPLAARGGTTP